jgi:hypothetical protein
LLSAPLSSTRSSPAPGLRSVVVRSAAGAAHMSHHSSPASQVVQGGNVDGNVGLASRPCGSEADMASAYSDSVPARKCLISRSSYNVY